MRETSIPRMHPLVVATILAVSAMSACAGPAAAQSSKQQLYDAFDEANALYLSHGQAAERCDRAAMHGAKTRLDQLEAEARRAYEKARAGQLSGVDQWKAQEIYDHIRHFRQQAEAQQPRNCGSSAAPVETVIDDIPHVQVIDDEPPTPKTGAADEPAAPREVENIREELEAARQRQAKLRREARQPLKPDEQSLLDLHNRARSQVGSPPLEWDSQLAAQAASYGPALAQHGRPVHSPREGRETSRENLLQALPGTSPEKMIAVWTAERQHFVPGTFPNVSRTGNWADVGHYTQMVWPETTNVGCAIHRGSGQFDWLICRYSPPGNQDGKSLLSNPPVPQAQ